MFSVLVTFALLSVATWLNLFSDFMVTKDEYSALVFSMLMNKSCDKARFCDVMKFYDMDDMFHYLREREGERENLHKITLKILH